MSTPTFWIELPGDEHGNTFMPHAVIEGRKENGRMVIVAPEENAKYSGWLLHVGGGFAETAGPARPLTMAEHRALVADVTR